MVPIKEQISFTKKMHYVMKISSLLWPLFSTGISLARIPKIHPVVRFGNVNILPLELTLHELPFSCYSRNFFFNFLMKFGNPVNFACRSYRVITIRKATSKELVSTWHNPRTTFNIHVYLLFLCKITKREPLF